VQRRGSGHHDVGRYSDVGGTIRRHRGIGNRGSAVDCGAIRALLRIIVVLLALGIEVVVQLSLLVKVVLWLLIVVLLVRALGTSRVGTVARGVGTVASRVDGVVRCVGSWPLALGLTPTSAIGGIHLRLLLQQLLLLHVQLPFGCLRCFESRRVVNGDNSGDTHGAIVSGWQWRGDARGGGVSATCVSDGSAATCPVAGR
jgi:hypothetical protein